MLARTVHLMALGCSLVAATSSAQAPAAMSTVADSPQQLSPKAAYLEAINPLARARSFVSNWSDTEVAALTVAMARAKTECDARDATKFDGQDLIDLAQLCSVGQEFSEEELAARRYLDADGLKPQAMRAYADLLDAQLHQKKEPDALTTAQKMLASVPYEKLTADAIDESISYMQFVHTADALTLSAAREPLLLARMKAVGDSSAKSSDSEDTQTLHELYEDGMAFAALENLSGMPTKDTVSALDTALPEHMSPDDSIPIALSRKRFAWLGKPLPKIDMKTYLSMPGTLPQIPAPNVTTGLLLFPDWCVQCIGMAQKLPETIFTVEGHPAYVYGMMATTVPQHPQPEKPPEQPEHKQFDPADASNLLRETPTAVVGANLLSDFAATDVPFLVLTDSKGIVRVVQTVGDDALISGGLVDAAIARVNERWPSHPPSPAGNPQPVRTSNH